MNKSAFVYSVAAILILVILIFHISQYIFLTDDAFISFRYARNIADGLGPVFNAGERVEGYTNFLWVIILAMFSLIGIAPETMAKILSLFLSGALFGLVYYFNCRYFSRSKYDFFILIAPLLLALNRTYAVWSTGGLETRLFTLLTFLGMAFTVRAGDNKSGSFAPAALFFALAALTRPEGILLFASFFGYQILLRLIRKEYYGDIAKAALIFIIIVGAHFIFRLIYYGYPFPNTFYAKVTGAWIESGFLYIFLFIHEYGLYLLLPLVLFLFSKVYDRGRLRTIFDLRIPFVPYILYIIYLGGDHFEYRPLDIILPVMAISIQEGFRAMWYKISESRLKFIRPVVPLYAIIALILYTSSAQLSHSNFPDKYNSAIGMKASEAGSFLLNLPGLKSYLGLSDKIHARLASQFVCIRQEEHKMALEQVFIPQAQLYNEFIDKGYIDRNEIISLWCVGAIPYYTGLTTIDYLGLTDEHVAHRKLPDIPAKLLPIDKLMAHQKRADYEYLKERKVTYISVRPAMFFFPISDFFNNGIIIEQNIPKYAFLVPMGNYAFMFKSTLIPEYFQYTFGSKGLGFYYHTKEDTIQYFPAAGK
ncbi:MAG: hypothetical protein AB1746_07845 [Candidatus Zixiibacteriota bacterium]